MVYIWYHYPGRELVVINYLNSKRFEKLKTFGNLIIRFEKATTYFDSIQLMKKINYYVINNQELGKQRENRPANLPTLIIIYIERIISQFVYYLPSENLNNFMAFDDEYWDFYPMSSSSPKVNKTWPFKHDWFFNGLITAAKLAVKSDERNKYPE